MKRPIVWLLPAAMLYSSLSHADLLISEVLYDTPGTDSNEEWIELYNPECESISLSGYSIADNGSSFTLSGSIPAGGYLTIARNASGFSAMYGSSPTLSGMSLALGNSGDWVELSNGSGTVDMVAWENKVSGWDINAKDVSIYRISSVDTDSVSDWGVSGSDTPGTGSLTQNCSGNSGGSDSGGNTDDTSTVVNEADYYSDAIGLSGAALKAELQDIISANHTKLTYSEVWTALQYTDEDPNNTNNVILFYSQRSADKDDRDGTSGSDNDSWNREHVWAKSLGFPSTGQYGYTDIHHLRPADKTVNSSRGNKSFDNGGSAQGEAANTFTDSDSWEPSNVVKGDVARMIFYMETRYDGSDGNMPNLEIINSTSTSTGDPNIGVLCALYQWNKTDPVDAYEQRRNDRIAERQGNRNPFIDNPQWVDSIWGNRCN
ncbi:endonuclease [Marinomonas transparens]|uniref:Endonuclease n=1 Tax=Marinomonas transparens TaxID=2795388 RepID=A0A934JI31_9GAMM|nr:endonuclease [Marinomonas transparens]MBJ7536176.1 endonuclease [Marinomonas transparens]